MVGIGVYGVDRSFEPSNPMESFRYITAGMLAWSIINELKIAELGNNSEYGGKEPLFGFFETGKEFVEDLIKVKKFKNLDDAWGFLTEIGKFEDNKHALDLVTPGGPFYKTNLEELTGYHGILEKLQHEEPVPTEQIKSVESFFRKYEDFCDSKSHGGNI